MLAVLLLIASAPAPFVRPAPPVPAIAVGEYVMDWRGTPAPTSFRADGTYACLWVGNRPWHGRGAQAKGVLAVEEWPAGNPGLRHAWTVRLACPASGVLDGSSPWRLAPQAGGRID